MASAALLPAQRKKAQLKLPIPDKYERTTELDDNGLEQWTEYRQLACPNCQGKKTTVCFHCDGLIRNQQCLECKMKKKVTCRVCAGLGHVPDPLEKVVCPHCLGATIFPCDICGWEGGTMVKGGSKKPAACVACKWQGSYPCTVCRGARLVDPVKLKPSVGEASLKDLLKAREAIATVLAAMAEFEPGGSKTRKDIKAYSKLLTPATRYLPPLKSAQKAFEAVMKKALKGEVWIGHEEREVAVIKRFMQHHGYYLQHQKRLLDLCVERAEFNEKAQAAKGK